MSKNIFTSKTIVLNLVSLMVALGLFFGIDLGIGAEDQAAIADAVVATADGVSAAETKLAAISVAVSNVVSIALRLVTKTPVHV